MIFYWRFPEKNTTNFSLVTMPNCGILSGMRTRYVHEPLLLGTNSKRNWLNATFYITLLN